MSVEEATEIVGGECGSVEGRSLKVIIQDLSPIILDEAVEVAGVDRELLRSRL